MTYTLTLIDAKALSKLVKAYMQSAYIIFLPGCKTFPDIKRDFYATAISVVADNTGHHHYLTNTQDIRDGYLWLSSFGTDHYVPVPSVLDDLRDGLAVTAY